MKTPRSQDQKRLTESARKPPLLLLAIALLTLPVLASNEIVAVDLEQLRTKYTEMAGDIRDRRPPYDTFTDTERARLQSLQARALEIAASRQHYDELEAQERSELSELMQSIDAVASTPMNEQLVCRRERRRDSHLTIRVCKTAAQMRREREDARNLLDQRGHCINSTACGGGK